jgi:predicted DNA-binding protein (UPF0251 family)
MPRPRGCRRVAGPPGCVLFKPAGVPAAHVTEMVLEIDELEAIRLADLEGLYQEDAAERMDVSRQTFGRIVSSARRKVAQALVQGMSLRIGGGIVEMAEQRAFRCSTCGHEWNRGFGTGRPAKCPECGSTSIRRTDKQCGRGAGAGASSGSGRGRGRGRAGVCGRGR